MPPDPHDPRVFRHFAKMAADGSVAAIVEVADGSADPPDVAAGQLVDVSKLYPFDFTGVKVAPATLATKDPAAICTALETANKVPPDPQKGK